MRVRAFLNEFVGPTTCEHLDPLLTTVFGQTGGKTWYAIQWADYSFIRFIEFNYWTGSVWAGGFVDVYPPFDD